MTTPAQQDLLDRARRAYDAGDLRGARDLCEELLGLGRKNPEALHLLGITLTAMDRYDEAAAALERCAALRPKERAVQLSLGLAQLYRGRYGPALDRFDRVLKLDPGSLEALAGKADVFFSKGDHKKALGVLEPLDDAGRTNAEMGLTLARSLNSVGRHDEALAAIERHAADDGAPLETRRQLLFLRGKILERTGDFDEAFAVYERANAVQPVEYDPEAYRRRVDELIEVYSGENLRRLPRATHGLDLPVLVVGMPRTGSTLVERLIDAHPQARGAGESVALFDTVADLPLAIGVAEPYPRCVLAMDEAAADAAGRRYVESLAGPGRGVRRVVDKNLFNYEKLGLVSLIVPEARIIDCRRNPLDTCVSCFGEALYPVGHPYAGSLEHLGLRYRQYERMMDHWNAVLDHPVLRVDYEDLVTDQEVVSRRILEFLELPWSERCLKFHETRFQTRTLSVEQVRKPVYRSSVNRAERFAKHLAPLREALGLDT